MCTHVSCARVLGPSRVLVPVLASSSLRAVVGILRVRREPLALLVIHVLMIVRELLQKLARCNGIGALNRTPFQLLHLQNLTGVLIGFSAHSTQTVANGANSQVQKFRVAADG